MTKEVMREWTNKVWRTRPGSIFRTPAVLLYDRHRSHTHDETREYPSTRQNTTSLFIPSRMTSLLQPCDASWSKAMKSRVRTMWEKWLKGGEVQYMCTGKRKRVSYDTVAQWIVDAWSEIPREMIQESFVKCGIVAGRAYHTHLRALMKTRAVPDIVSGSDNSDSSDDDASARDGDSDQDSGDAEDVDESDDDESHEKECDVAILSD